jgi:hypothetical protein
VTAGAGVITGNSTATVIIAGTAAQINTALAGLAYTGNLNFNGADTLRVATIDGTAADIDTIAITVNAVNDAPALNLDANSSTIGGVDYLTIQPSTSSTPMSRSSTPTVQALPPRPSHSRTLTPATA